MDSTLPTIPPSAFDDILKELEERPLAVNKYRLKSGDGRSQSFGLVNRRCVPVDYSRQNWLRPKLLYHLQEFAKKYVDIPWTSITVNQSYQCQPHRDRGNLGVSFLVAFGDFTGGELELHEGTSLGLHDIRHKPMKMDFSQVLHSVKPFSGNRYSLVFYTLKATKMPDEPLPKGEAVFENGKYLFKRGDQIITLKNGLPHPKRGKKMPMKKRAGDFSVSFD